MKVHSHDGPKDIRFSRRRRISQSDAFGDLGLSCPIEAVAVAADFNNPPLKKCRVWVKSGPPGHADSTPGAGGIADDLGPIGPLDAQVLPLSGPRPLVRA